MAEQKQTHRYRKQTGCYQWREESVGGGALQCMRLRDAKYYI